LVAPFIVSVEGHRFWAIEQLRWEGDVGHWLNRYCEDRSDAAIHVPLPVACNDPRYLRPTEVETLLGEPNKAKQKLGWVSEMTLD
jgi:GDP-D-mannose dehydratase